MQLEPVSRLAAGVARSLDDLLTPILGYSDLLLAALGPGTKGCDQVREIRRAAERSRDLVRQLAAFGRQQVLVLRPADLRDIASGMEGAVRRSLPANVSLSVECGAEPATVNVDRSRIDQVIVNIAGNALEAMPCGGSLSLEARAARQEDLDAAEHAGFILSDAAVLRVCDTGTGMSGEVCEHLFEPYYSTKSAAGSGLGLATVWGIVHQHGGVVLVDSLPGRGTAVVVLLPRA